MPCFVPLRFGVEIEVLTGSKGSAHFEWHLTAREVSYELHSIGLKNHAIEDREGWFGKWDNDFSEWTVQRELSVRRQIEPDRCKWGIELVSPILNFQQPDVWRTQIRDVWWVLKNKFDTCSNEQCSTHVHISPSGGQWDLDHVKHIAKAAVYFERCTDLIVPPSRRVSDYCESNRWNCILESHPMSTLFSRIDAAESTRRIAFLMCATEASRDDEEGDQSTYSFDRKNFRWNFTTLNPERVESYGTIEFRQPPGSASAEDTQLWITFAASFVQGAIQCIEQIDPNTAPSMELFRSFLLDGASLSGVSDLLILDRYLAGKTIDSCDAKLLTMGKLT